MTVVLCGSLGTTAGMWDALRPALDGLDVVDVEHPGHGGAPVVELDGVDGLARLVLERVDAPVFSFVGLSLGAAVGIELARLAPERLERLAVCCASPRFGAPEQWHERAALVRGHGLKAIVDAVLARWFTPAFADVQRFREMFLSVDAEGYARCCEALASWEARGVIAAPTLCIAGEDDPTSPPDDLAALVPGARLVVLPQSRHLAPIERADVAGPLLREHVS